MTFRAVSGAGVVGVGFGNFTNGIVDPSVFVVPSQCASDAVYVVGISFPYYFLIQSTPVISNSKRLTETLRDFRASTYQS